MENKYENTLIDAGRGDGVVFSPKGWEKTEVAIEIERMYGDPNSPDNDIIVESTDGHLYPATPSTPCDILYSGE